MTQKARIQTFQYRHGIRQRTNPLTPIFVLATLVLSVLTVQQYAGANADLARAKAANASYVSVASK
jgi:hypothetical protein